MTAVAEHTYLVLDETGFRSRHNTEMRICAAEKHPHNPLLPLGRIDEWDATQARPWESRTVLYDEEDGLFKCWYSGTDVSTDRWWLTGYARSEDGIRWEKPRLGLIDYQGSTDNNIVLRGWGPVIKDDGEQDPERRFKMIVNGPVPIENHGIRVAYSPDGIRWREDNPVSVSTWDNLPDIVAFTRDDQELDPQRRYKIVWQNYVDADKPGPAHVRGKSLAFGPDVEHLTASPHNPLLSPNDGPEQENHFLMLFPYEGIWLMPYECGWYLINDFATSPNYGQYVADIRLAMSHDGECFTRVNPHQQLIRRGGRGEWDDGFLVISDKPVIKDDMIYLYYCGQGEDWTSWPVVVPSYPFASTGSVRTSRMGLATLRRDRFAAVETMDGEIPGFIETQELEPGPLSELLVNVGGGQTNRSWLAVEIVDAGGRVLPGFDQQACRKLDGDGIRCAVSWNGKQLADIDVPRVRFRFHLYGRARLYAYSLR